MDELAWAVDVSPPVMTRRTFTVLYLGWRRVFAGYRWGYDDNINFGMGTIWLGPIALTFRKGSSR